MAFSDTGVPTLAAAFEGRHKHSLLPLAIAALVVVILIAVGLCVFMPQSQSTAHAQRVAFIQEGSVHWYEISGSSLVPAAGPAGFDGNPHHIADATQKLVSNDTPVLSSDASSIATTLAVFRGDGTYVPLLADATQKTQLSVSAQGNAAYTVVSGTSSTTVAWFPINGGASAAVPLGDGFSPAVTTSGAVLALSAAGIVHIEAPGALRSTILSRPGLTYGNAAISPGAGYAALPNSVTGQVDVFALDSAQGASTNYIASVDAHPTAIAFLSPTTFLVLEGSSATEYAIGSTTVSTVGTFTIK